MSDELEKLIDEAGRDEVFRRAEVLGWPRGSAVPTYVWRQIAAEVKAQDSELGPWPPWASRPAGPPKRIDEELFGFRLF